MPQEDVPIEMFLDPSYIEMILAKPTIPIKRTPPTKKKFTGRVDGRRKRKSTKSVKTNKKKSIRKKGKSRRSRR